MDFTVLEQTFLKPVSKLAQIQQKYNKIGLNEKKSTQKHLSFWLNLVLTPCSELFHLNIILAFHSKTAMMKSCYRHFMNVFLSWFTLWFNPSFWNFCIVFLWMVSHRWSEVYWNSSRFEALKKLTVLKQSPFHYMP